MSNWVMALTWVGVSIWSCFDGQRTGTMMLVAAIGSVALVQMIATLFSLLRPTRLVQALFSGTMVMAFMPAWDWLAMRWLYPESLWTALGFGAAFGFIRFTFGPRPPARPPS
ncbi:MAG: hypothetical protein K0R39_508 [Symbiobacteriaceae bacterium]|jgi:hypothetical protein|nr:hypothetical protein [Symbiobacteriaceae bacterium]